jgi:hypothetical protein
MSMGGIKEWAGLATFAFAFTRIGLFGKDTIRIQTTTSNSDFLYNNYVLFNRISFKSGSTAETHYTIRPAHVFINDQQQT